MAELSLTKKVFIVGATWFSLFFTGGTIFGYSALKQSLLENEVLFLFKFYFFVFLFLNMLRRIICLIHVHSIPIIVLLLN